MVIQEGNGSSKTVYKFKIKPIYKNAFIAAKESAIMLPLVE